MVNILRKVLFLTTPPLKNGLVQKVMHIDNLWRIKFLVNVDVFHGSERI